MRLSEKTIELNFCAQLTAGTPTPVLWFGLTQRQEAAAGFDAATRFHGRVLLFQFKASDYILRSGYRRFYLSHHQMKALQTRAKGRMRSVFYAFPFLGTTVELASNPLLLTQTGLLDVSTLPSIGPPTTSVGSPRKNELHYADVRPWAATLHSECQRRFGIARKRRGELHTP